MNKCLIVSFDGRNGYARVNTEVDDGEFQSRYANKLKLNKRALTKYMNGQEDTESWQFASSVYYYVQIAKPNGPFCGAERPQCGASGQPFPT